MTLTGTEIAVINWTIKGVEWVAKIGKSASKRFPQTDPVARVKRREELRNELHRRLRGADEFEVRGDAIIRDINRIDSYPRLDDRRKGTFPWFKVEIRGLYHSGLEVFIGVRREIKKDMYGNWKFVNSHNEDTTLVYTVGRIPFDVIEHIDWDGDEYCHSPHIYCRFEASKKQPYEEIVYFAKIPGSEDLYEVKDFRPWDKKKRFWFLNNWDSKRG